MTKSERRRMDILKGENDSLKKMLDFYHEHTKKQMYELIRLRTAIAGINEITAELEEYGKDEA